MSLIPTRLTVSVTSLITFTQRQGGLAEQAYSGVSGIVGTRTHQAFYKKLDELYPGASVETERGMAADFTRADFVLHVQGRCDLVISPPEGSPFILEVKTVNQPLGQQEGQAQLKEGSPLHWAQARAYTAMQTLVDPAPDSGDPARTCQYGLAYVSWQDLSSVILTREESVADLQAWFHNTCGSYLSFARSLAGYRAARNASIREMGFPYPSLRDGQRMFMEKVLHNLRSRTPLLVQAPTGTGKTMSTLYPSVKALGAGIIDQVFYLTAKTPTRQVARDALNDMRASGLMLRSVSLTAKEKLCLEPELYCDTLVCPYAQNYYQKITAVLDAGLELRDIGRDEIISLAGQGRVCPFELQLDLSSYCDVVIGDYNYAFDPRIRLERFFSEKGPFHYALLVDEAHNLPDRARGMYSAELSDAQLKAASAGLATLDPSYPSLLDGLNTYLGTLRHHLTNGKDDDPCWNAVEPQADLSRLLAARNFRGVRAQTPRLNGLLWQLVTSLRDLFTEFEDYPAKRAVQDLYFAAVFWLKVQDQYWSERYVLTASMDKDSLVLAQACLDVSDKLIEVFRNQHAAVFFSATLTPLSYFAESFCGTSRDDQPDELLLPSPFPSENLLLVLATGIPTTYKERPSSASALAATLADGILACAGNSLVFFPSYAYLRQIEPQLRRLLEGRPVDLMIQRREMNEPEREAFIAEFARDRAGRLLCGIAVMGGAFAEGIDLKGEQLRGVLIVGVGLPQLSPEREILKQYYEANNGLGFESAYLYPGINKVLQAAGRLIRTDTDTGLIMLIDQRYARADYRQLLPEEWQPVECRTASEVKAALKAIPSPLRPGLPDGSMAD